MPDSKNSKINKENTLGNVGSEDYVVFCNGSEEITFFNVCPDKANIAKKLGAIIHNDFKIWCTPNATIAVAMSKEFTPLTKEELDILCVACKRLTKNMKEY